MATPSPSADRSDSAPLDSTKPSWKAILEDAIADPAELCRWLELPPAPDGAAERITAGFPLRVPRTFVGRMRHADPCDPLLRQVLPRAEEAVEQPLFTKDPLGEAGITRSPGLLWKYPNRLLIVAASRCGVHCRFCFRRHFSYPADPESPHVRNSLLKRIAEETSLHEIILSGGDPLTLDDGTLAAWVHGLAEIPHIQRVRLHSRMVVVVPQRVTPELTRLLRSTRLAPIVVIHANHPAEIDPEAADALTRLLDAGISVLCQSVLLRGVNDSVDVLAELMERLVNLRVMPYYLHQLDRVAGAAHFEVPEEEGVRLVEALRQRLPGYAVPRYVRETPEACHKLVLA